MAIYRIGGDISEASIKRPWDGHATFVLHIVVTKDL